MSVEAIPRFLAADPGLRALLLGGARIGRLVVARHHGHTVARAARPRARGRRAGSEAERDEPEEVAVKLRHG